MERRAEFTKLIKEMFSYIRNKNTLVRRDIMQVLKLNKVGLITCFTVLSFAVLAQHDDFNLIDDSEEELHFADIDSVFSASNTNKKLPFSWL
jgi:chromosome condensin MukBEF MukE localization factor